MVELAWPNGRGFRVTLDQTIATKAIRLLTITDQERYASLSLSVSVSLSVCLSVCLCVCLSGNLNKSEYFLFIRYPFGNV